MENNNVEKVLCDIRDYLANKVEKWHNTKDLGKKYNPYNVSRVDENVAMLSHLIDYAEGLGIDLCNEIIKKYIKE